MWHRAYWDPFRDELLVVELKRLCRMYGTLWYALNLYKALVSIANVLTSV